MSSQSAHPARVLAMLILAALAGPGFASGLGSGPGTPSGHGAAPGLGAGVWSGPTQAQELEEVGAAAREALLEWYQEHEELPYPNPEELQDLVRSTGLSAQQVRLQLGDLRLRFWLPAGTGAGALSLPEPAGAGGRARRECD